MKIIYIIVLVCFSVSAEVTIWEEMPRDQKERFQYFKKNDRSGVFDAYEKMQGKKYIFACVNAVIFHLYAYEDDTVGTPEAANKRAELKCAEKQSFPGMSLKVPMGTPVLLGYEGNALKSKKHMVIDEAISSNINDISYETDKVKTLISECMSFKKIEKFSRYSIEMPPSGGSLAWHRLEALKWRDDYGPFARAVVVLQWDELNRFNESSPKKVKCIFYGDNYEIDGNKFKLPF